MQEFDVLHSEALIHQKGKPSAKLAASQYIYNARYGAFINFWATCHYDVIKWKHFPRYWPYVRGIHRSPANSPHKGQ